MATVLSYEEAKKNQFRVEPDGTEKKGGVLNTPFLGSLSASARNRHEMPQAFFSIGDPGRFSTTHFHGTDQFQIIIGGKGRLGRHALIPFGVHFARAYTPYGPLAADADSSLVTFTLRSHHDPLGAQRFPEKQAVLDQMPNRQPWQVFVPTVSFPSLNSQDEARLQEIPQLKDDRGLAVYTLSMKPNAETTAPDPANGDGQYLLLIKGGIVHEGKEHKAYGLVFIKPDEGSYRIRASADGLEAILLNFPQPLDQGGSGKTVNALAAGDSQAWRCRMCAFVYDPEEGLAEEGIARNTSWQDVPKNWSCPNCSSAKSFFKKA